MKCFVPRASNYAVIMLMCFHMSIGFPSPVGQCSSSNCKDCLENPNCVYCLSTISSCAFSGSTCDEGTIIIPPSSIDVCPEVITTTSKPEIAQPLLGILIYAVCGAMALIFVIWVGHKMYAERIAPAQQRRRQERRQLNGQVAAVAYNALEEAVEMRHIQIHRHEIPDNGDHNDEPELAEPIPGPSNKQWNLREQDILDTFDALDVDDDGFINESDLKIAAASIGAVVDENDLAELIDSAGPDSHGRVSYEKFRRMMIYLDHYPPEL